MFDADISLTNILVSFEGTLKIEYGHEQKTKDIIEQSIARLENAYSMTFDRDVYTIQKESQLLADSINLLLRDVGQCMANMAMYTALKVYHKNLEITLADVNYLGYAREKLMANLSCLLDETMAEQYSADMVQPLYTALNNISICVIKRLFIILLMLYRLGIHEGVSIVAQLIYLGGLVV